MWRLPEGYDGRSGVVVCAAEAADGEGGDVVGEVGCAECQECEECTELQDALVRYGILEEL